MIVWTVVWSVIIVAFALVQIGKGAEHAVYMTELFRATPSSPLRQAPVARWAKARGKPYLVPLTDFLWRGPVLLCANAVVLAASVRHAWHPALFIGSVALVTQLVLLLISPIAVAVAISLGRPIDFTLSTRHYLASAGDAPIHPALMFISLAGSITMVFMAEYLVTRHVRPEALVVKHGLGFGVLDSFYLSFCTLTTFGDPNVEARLMLAKICTAGELACSAVLLVVLVGSVLKD